MPAKVIAAFLVVVAAACGNDAPSPAAAKQCEARMDALSKRLVPLAATSPAVAFVPADFDPIESDRGAPIDDHGPVLEIARDGRLAIFGEPLESPDELAARMKWEEELGGPLSALYVLIDRRASKQVAERALAGVPAGTETRAIVVGAQRQKTARDRELEAKPSVRTLFQRMEGADPSSRAAALADAISDAVVPCAPLVRVFGSVASVDAHKKSEIMAVEGPKAIRECKCQMKDLDLLEYALLAVFDAFGRPQRWIPIDQALASLPG